MVRTRLLRPRLAGMVIITAMVASAMTVLSSPASAVVPGLQIVSRDSAFNSVSPKSATATCPFVPGTATRKRVVGTGADLLGGGGDVTITAIRPSTFSVTATGDEEHIAITGNWRVRAYAICANP